MLGTSNGSNSSTSSTMLMGMQTLPVFGCTQNGDFKICHAHILGLLGRDSLIGTPRLATQYLFKKSVHFSSGVVISPSLFRFVAKVLLCTLYAMEDPFQG